MVYIDMYFAVGTTNIKAKVLKDGHLFVVHILDPELEMGEEIPVPEDDPEWPQSLAEMVAEQNSGMKFLPLLLLVAGLNGRFFAKAIIVTK